MGLENLKSIFTEGMNKFKNTELTTMDSGFTEDIESLTSDFQRNAPLLGESIVVGMTSTYTKGIGGLFNKSTTYTSTKFPFPISANVPSIEQILTSGNTGGGGYQLQKSSYDKYNVATPGEDINVSGIAIRTTDGLGNLISSLTENRKFPSNTSWSNLYRADHKSKGVGYNYGSNVRSVFSMRDEAPNVTGISRTQLFGGPHGEPYIISGLPDGDIGGLGKLGDGRLQNFASRSIPIVRAVTDAVRLTKYLSSPQGLLNIVLKNVPSVIPSVVIRNPKDNKLKRVPQRFKVIYNPLSTILSAGTRLLGTTPNLLFDKTEPGLLSLFKSTTYGEYIARTNQTSIHDTFEKGTPLLNSNKKLGFLDKLTENLGLNSTVVKQITGDKMTLAPMIHGTKIEDGQIIQPQSGDGFKKKSLGVDVESPANGMPFYFKDLRDNTYILFRAYIDGLTENISPSWSSTNYLGRSEPVYVYERSERDISFTLKLFAQTETELTSIYQKMNRLTSLCYPQYTPDTNMNDKLRMKPPLTKFRLGELFGSQNNELTGFIKSISYTYPQESPWETKVGKRVPKYVQVSISYQVIHMKVPSLDFVKKAATETFYGLNQPTWAEQTSAKKDDKIPGHIGTGVE